MDKITRFLKNPLGIGITVFVIVVIGSFLLKYVGFHVQDLKLVRGGDVIITEQPIDARVFLDRNKIEINKDSSTKIDNVTPGTHTLLVFDEVYWPWTKNITIGPNETISINPFLVRKNASGVILTVDDPEYDSISSTIKKEKAPSVDAPKVSKSGLVSVWTEGTNVFATWTGPEETLPDYFCNDDKVCEKTSEVLNSTEPIRNLDFYKDYDDILIVAFLNGIFVIEIDKRGVTQNFQPIYQGTANPRFVKVDKNTIQVIDGSSVFIINL